MNFEGDGGIILEYQEVRLDAPNLLNYPDFLLTQKFGVFLLSDVKMDPEEVKQELDALERQIAEDIKQAEEELATLNMLLACEDGYYAN